MALALSFHLHHPALGVRGDPAEHGAGVGRGSSGARGAGWTLPGHLAPPGANFEAKRRRSLGRRLLLRFPISQKKSSLAGHAAPHSPRGAADGPWAAEGL